MTDRLERRGPFADPWFVVRVMIPPALAMAIGGAAGLFRAENKPADYAILSGIMLAGLALLIVAAYLLVSYRVHTRAEAEDKRLTSDSALD